MEFTERYKLLKPGQDDPYNVQDFNGNAAAMGAPVPQWLVKLLAVSRGAVDSAGDKLGGEDGEGA